MRAWIALLKTAFSWVGGNGSGGAKLRGRREGGWRMEPRENEGGVGDGVVAVAGARF